MQPGRESAALATRSCAHVSDVFAWYLTLQLTALAVWPLLRRACASLTDRGWAASKITGPLFAAWLAWLIGMVVGVQYTRVVLALTILVVAAGCWLWPYARAGPKAAIACLRQRRLEAVAVEVALAVSLGFFLLLRSYAPSIAGTEKPMDMAFLNGFATAERLPTADTWLSGYGMPYYHFGYLIFACVIKLSGVPAAVGYNLAAATIPALAGIGPRVHTEIDGAAAFLAHQILDRWDRLLVWRRTGK